MDLRNILYFTECSQRILRRAYRIYYADLTTYIPEFTLYVTHYTAYNKALHFIQYIIAKNN